MLLRILLTAETPLSFRTGRNPARSETLLYVPGASVIGGLAQAYQSQGRDKTTFAEFFLNDRILFGNCYPADFKTDQLKGDERPVLPLPLTARSCKRFGGFKFNAQTEEEIRAGVTDTLIPLALFAMTDEQRPDLLTPLEKHPDTHYPLDRIGGFFRRGAKENHYGQPETNIAIRTRTGINYRTGTVRSAILYSRQVIPEGSSFWGCWWIDDDLWEAFKPFIESGNQGMLRIGNNRTRGFGRVRLNARPLAEDSVDDIRIRTENFTKSFKAAAQAAQIEAPDALYIPVTLTSDAILYDPLLRARLQLSPDDLLNIPEAKLIFHTATSRHVAGWSTLWGLPKADDWAIGMGSVFLFALPQIDDTTFVAIHRLQQQGIGERRAEGFGMISIANPFHSELAGAWR